MKENCIHYVASDSNLGFEKHRSEVCLHLSAGHDKHEYTTGTAWEWIIK